jgi:hypothetical protein
MMEIKEIKSQGENQGEKMSLCGPKGWVKRAGESTENGV